MKLTQDDIKAYLAGQGFTAEVQKETGQLVAVFAIEGKDFPTFFRIAEEGPVLQVVTFFPFTYSANSIGEVARLLHLLNKEIDLPGFGIDESSATLFYRTAIPSPDKTLDEARLGAALNAMQLACRTFAGVIAAVASGSLTFEEALKKAAGS